MISSARVLTAPQSARTQRALSPVKSTGAGTLRMKSAYTIIICMMGLLGLVVLMLTHAGTYNASLTRTSGQANSLIGSNIVQQGTREGQPIPPARTTTTHTGSVVAHAQSIARMNQLDPAQYNPQQDYNTWSPSTCSTSSMTFVMNSYGHHYRIADVLKVEVGLHEITPDSGLLEPAGIDRTVAPFGFQTSWLHTPTLADVLKAADSGTPVIVGFPLDTWSGGHLLVVRGSYTSKGIQYVHLADSSKLNMQYMVQETFLKYWRGFAVIVYPKGTSLPPVTTPATGGVHSVLGKPTISAAFLNQVLASYHSPAEGRGQALYDLGVKYGIDPAFALAFFLHESTFGTAGEARTTLSLGNLRCIPNVACVDQDRGGYASFASWEDGFQARYELIRNYYIAQRGLTTIEKIIPVYAPTSDNNDEAAYIASLKHALDTWRAGILRP